uniref:Phospholipid phosphatase 1 n=1 Tax=Xiphophorus couchianus TaxID=32473 RepID=A0A3B5LZJ6_9TELE
ARLVKKKKNDTMIDFFFTSKLGLPFFILTPRHSPFKRGFFCNDESIRFPYKEDTISYQLLLGVMIPFTLIALLCGEFLSVYMCRIKSRSLKRKWMMCVYKAVGSSLFGAAASQSLTDIAKYSIGRLRPYFLAVCKPVWNQIDCKTGGYIENFTCFIFEFNLLSNHFFYSVLFSHTVGYFQLLF